MDTIKEYEFGVYVSRGLVFTFAPGYLYDDGTVDKFTATILYKDMEAFGERLGFDPRQDDWLTEQALYDEMVDRVEHALPFLADRFYDVVADEAGEMWYYLADDLEYHASKHGVTVNYKVTA